MEVQSLTQQAGLKIPINHLFFAEEHQGNVINQEFLHHVKIPRKLGIRDLRSLCEVCKKNEDCLCYLFQIRYMMIECYWNTELDYQFLGDWLTLTNRHAK